MLRRLPLSRVARHGHRLTVGPSLCPFRWVTSEVSQATLEAPPKLPIPDSQGISLVGPGAADLVKVPDMNSGQLRKLAQAAAAEGAASELWAALAQRCEDTADRLNYWDAVHILQAFTEAQFPLPEDQNRSLFLSLGEALSAKTSKMATKHVLDLLAVYEAADLRPRGLYVELLHTLVKLSRSMYAEEVALTLQALARYELGNPTVIAQLMRTIQSEIKEFRFRYLCATAGALGVLQACPPEFMEILDTRARFEVDTISLQELLDNLQAFPQLEFSWKAYEDMCLDEFLERISQLRTAEDVDQLVDPFSTLFFLQSHGVLHADFLRALCQWSLKGVHRPNVRSERRPTSQQLVILHDFCFEYGLEEEPALQDALAFFVESGGGLWHHIYPQPLAYHKKRRYIRTDDPLEGMDLPELPDAIASKAVVQSRTPARRMEELPGLPSMDESEDALTVAEVGEVLDAPVRRRRKESGPSPLLKDPEDTLVYRIRTRSRKGPRPRHTRDPLRKRDWEKETVPGPLWYYGSWRSRPKYQPGQSLGPRYPYARVPVGPRGASWILRR